MFNKKEFGYLLEKAKGKRSINKYSADSGVASAHISRLIRGMLDTAPSPQTISKLANSAHDDVTYADLMSAAGHMDLVEQYMAKKEKHKKQNDYLRQTVLSSVYQNMSKKIEKDAIVDVDEEFKSKIDELYKNEDLDSIIKLIAKRNLEMLHEFRELDSNTEADNESIYTKNNFIEASNIIKVPLLGSIRAGLPVTAQEDIEEYVEISNPTKGDGSDIFLLRVKGDSMVGSRIYEGDKVVVRSQTDVENGEIAVVKVNGDDATLKKVKKYDDGSIWLLASNDKYAPIPLNDERAQIIGKVIQVIFEP